MIPMFRFTIRDVLWLTVAVAMGLAWRFERHSDALALSKSERLVKAKAMQFESLLGQLEAGMPTAVRQESDGLVTVSTTNDVVIHYELQPAEPNP
jgi:hypothetical protein